MKKLDGKVALVTGAASGIGRATALSLAREGVGLVLVDVDAEGLDEVASEVNSVSICVLARTTDVSNRDDMAALAEQVHELVPGIDILINNAGVYLTGGILDLSLDDWEWVLGVDLWGVIHGCHFFVPHMVKRGMGGHVVNVSSMFGFWASPDVIGYLTAKFGVFGFSEALREDLRGAGIGVSTVCPGIVRTGIIDNMRDRIGGNADGVRARLSGYYKRRDYEPEKVARAILKTIRRSRGRVVLVSPEARAMYYVERLFPTLSRLIARSAAARMFAP